MKCRICDDTGRVEIHVMPGVIELMRCPNEACRRPVPDYAALKRELEVKFHLEGK